MRVSFPWLLFWLKSTPPETGMGNWGAVVRSLILANHGNSIDLNSVRARLLKLAQFHDFMPPARTLILTAWFSPIIRAQSLRF